MHLPAAHAIPAYIGPVLAQDLLRRAGHDGDDVMRSVAVALDLGCIAVTNSATLSDAGLAIDVAGSSAAALLLSTGRREFIVAEAALSGATGGVDLTRPVAALPTGAAINDIDGGATLNTDDLTAWTALAVTLTAADLVGVMEGALDLSCEYAKQRHQFGSPIGSYQAVQHLLAEAKTLIEGAASAMIYAARAVDALAPTEARGAAAVAKAYASRAAQTVCETTIQVHGGIGNTWECMAHVFLRRALLSTELFGGDGPQLALLAHQRWGATNGLHDSPDEAAFRQRIRNWWTDNGTSLKRSHSDDSYWTALGDWHRTLYEAGFFALTWPKKYGGRELSPVCEVIVDEELARAGAPPKPSLGYLIQGISHHGDQDVKDRFLPGLINGRERWCQGFSEPDAGSDLASLRTTAVLDGDEYVINGHKIWTSYSDVANWCILLARTNQDVPKHKGLSAFAVPMNQPGIEQRPLRMINGITTEFGQVSFENARASAANMIGAPGEGWALAMTIVSHEREPAELGFFARYAKTVAELEGIARQNPSGVSANHREQLTWAYVQSEMLRLHTARRLSERLAGVTHGPDGSIDKLLMTWVEQSVGHAALAFGGAQAIAGGNAELLDSYLYSRSQSVMGGTSQIQKNIIATRILGLPIK